MEPKGRIISALDFDSPITALGLAGILKGHVGLFKVGLRLFTGSLLKRVDILGSLMRPENRENPHDSGLGVEVFEDFKFGDIPDQVKGASFNSARLEVAMFTVKTSDGVAVLKAAREGVDNAYAEHGCRKPIILGVTVLTSMDFDDFEREGTMRLNEDAPEHARRDMVQQLVVTRARLAQDCGLDGCVASPQEAAMIRDACGSDFAVVTPGVSPSGGTYGDQKRTGTAWRARHDGAHYVVVGRAFTQSKEPVKVAGGMAADIAAAEKEE